MTDDLDLVDPHTEQQDPKPNEKSKRGRLKEVLDRTKHKISEKVREEKEARKWSLHSDKEQSGNPYDTDIDDFLAAGRAKTASTTQLSVYSDTTLTDNGTIHNGSSTPPRPSTSDSKTQFSPRRVPVPRIDVSTSRRFPNAKEVGTNGPAELPGSPAFKHDAASQTSLLPPEFKPRSYSTGCFASASRKARIRNLSVGFAETPPTIIGIGGDDAEAPPVEISRAKMRRAQSASPQGRVRQPGSHVLPEERRQTSGSIEHTFDGFNPNQVSKIQTGTPQAHAGMNTAIDTSYNDFVPKPARRTQTGLSDFGNSPIAQHAPQQSTRNSLFLPPDLGQSHKVTLDRTREMELSLGLTPGSPTTGKLQRQEPRIYAPKPQRAPPSYDLIEKGRTEQESERSAGASPRQNPPLNAPPQASHQLPGQQTRPLQQVSHHITQRASYQDLLQRTSQQIPQKTQRREISQPTHPQIAYHDDPQKMAVVHELPTSVQDKPSTPMFNDSRQRVLSVERPPKSQQTGREHAPQTQVYEGQFSVDQQRYQLPEQDFGERLEMPIDQIVSPNSTHQNQRDPEMYPEFETFLRSDQLQDQDSPPKYNISRFASLNSPVMRTKQNSPRQHSLPEHDHHVFPDQLPASHSKVLSPLNTSDDRSVPRPFAERTRPSPRQSPRQSPRPTSLVGSPATGSPQAYTTRRISPLKDYETSPGGFSSTLTSPQSANESGASKLRFHETPNQSIPPAGYI